MENFCKYAKILLNIIIPVSCIILVCFLGPWLLRFFMPFVIGWIIAMIANPLVRLLERRLKIVRRHSSMMIIIAVLAATVGLLYLIMSKLITEAISFSKDLPMLYEMASDQISNLFQILPSGLQTSIDQFMDHIGEYGSLLLQKFAPPTVEVAGNLAKGIPGALVYSIITILSSYFFIAERDSIIEFARRFMPREAGKYFMFLKKDVRHLIGGYFLAQFKIMFVVAGVLAVGFLILGVKYGLFFALLIALLDFLPLFGTGTALFPWALVQLISGKFTFAAVLLLLYVATQTVRQLLQPKIVGDSMGLPPLLTLFMLYMGFKVRGITGMILAVPVGLIIINLYKYGAFNSLLENMRILVHDIDEFRKKK